MNMKFSSAVPMSEKIFGLMGRLHLVLRREMGRVTDTKYMSMNADYCIHVLELARELEAKEIDTICQQLEEHFFGFNSVFGVDLPKHLQRKPSVQLSSRVPVIEAQMPKPTSVKLASESAEVDQHYVGRLR